MYLSILRENVPCLCSVQEKKENPVISVLEEDSQGHQVHMVHPASLVKTLCCIKAYRCFISFFQNNFTGSSGENLTCETSKDILFMSLRLQSRTRC